MASFGITEKLLSELKQLDDQLVHSCTTLHGLPADELAAIHRYARISNLGASTRIENAVLTDSEINWLDTVLSADGHITAFNNHKVLIENKLSKDRERSIEEVAGCRAMLLLIYERALELFPLTEHHIRALHSELMRPYLKNSPYVGSYKINSNSVVEKNHHSGEAPMVFKTAGPGPMTQSAMHELIAWYNNHIAGAKPWELPVVCEFVFRFLAIHPFQDGNGRLGRGLFILALLQSQRKALQTVAPYLALDRQIERYKEEYYFVLNSCSDGQFNQDAKQYHMKHFLAFMIKMMKSLVDIEVYRSKYQAVQRLSPSATQVLHCFREHPEVRLTTKILCEETDLPRRTFINALNALLQAQLIQKYGQGAATHYKITF